MSLADIKLFSTGVEKITNFPPDLNLKKNLVNEMLK